MAAVCLGILSRSRKYRKYHFMREYLPLSKLFGLV